MLHYFNDCQIHTCWRYDRYDATGGTRTVTNHGCGNSAGVVDISDSTTISAGDSD